MGKIQMTFLPHEAGTCAQCGKKQDALFLTTLSDDSRTQSMALCRECAMQMHTRVDKYNAKYNDAQPQPEAPQPSHRQSTEPSARQTRRKTRRKSPILIVIASALSLVLIASVVFGVVLHSRFAADDPKSTDGWIDETHLYFGSYPQSEVKDAELIAVLNLQKTEWHSYEYFCAVSPDNDDDDNGKMQPSDFMQFCDIIYENQKYRGVKFSELRPSYTGLFTDGLGMQDDQGYYPNMIYWFKYEPLCWTVLDADNGLVMSNLIIDSQPFNNYLLHYFIDDAENNGIEVDDYFGDESKTYLANNYEKSSIRSWLTDEIKNGFIDTAFSEKQKEIISETELKTYSVLEETTKTSIINDKVFLLSYNDVINSLYGFSNSPEAEDITRQVEGSDYAKCQGLSVFSNGYSNWLLRSSDSDCGKHIYGVNAYGNVENGSKFQTHCTFIGVRPALTVDLKSKAFKKNDDSKKNNNELLNQSKSKFSIEGKWKNVGDISCAQMQAGSITSFDGTHCNVYSPNDTYAFYESNGDYHLDCTSFFAGDSMNFLVRIIDNDNIELICEKTVVELHRVS